MMTQQAERLCSVPCIQPLEAEIGDNVGCVSLILSEYSVFNHWRIKIGSLTDENVPIVEAGRLSMQMPFSNYRHLIPPRLEQFWKGNLISVEQSANRNLSVDVGVGSGKDGCPARCAE